MKSFLLFFVICFVLMGCDNASATSTNPQMLIGGVTIKNSDIGTVTIPVSPGQQFANGSLCEAAKAAIMNQSLQYTASDATGNISNPETLRKSEVWSHLTCADRQASAP